MKPYVRQDERKLHQLARVDISGGLLPEMTLLTDLIKFLNGTKTRRGKRVVTILERMLQLEEITRPIKPEEPMIAALEWKRTDPDKYQLHWDIEKRRAMLNGELSRYRFTPHARVVMGGGGQGPSQWAAWWRGDSAAAKPEGRLRMVASEALELLLKLTQIGDLSRLRRCAHCQNWLYARFRHQTFCSTKCQQKHYTQTEQWKEHRRRYMRNRYRQLFGQSLSTRRPR
jgi:hypothetical protein